MAKETNLGTAPLHSPQTSQIYNGKVNGERFTANEGFYNALPAVYYSFYSRWVRLWLQWYDGFVPQIHGDAYGFLSTGIGTTIVKRCNEQIFGGNIKFANARTPISTDETADGKKKGRALDFISNKWIKQVRGKSVLKKCGEYALAGGFSLLKINRLNGELWLDAVRADRFYIERAGSQIRKVRCCLNFFEDTTNRKGSTTTYMLVEERRFEDFDIVEEHPVVEYKIYKTNEQVEYFLNSGDAGEVPWAQLPKEVKSAFKRTYGNVMLNKPQVMTGFETLGVYQFNASEGVHDVPQIDCGESILANVLAYLFEYDFYFTALNTDVYLGRGRILIPKQYQRNAKKGSTPNSFDDFAYTEYPTVARSGEENKPEAIQFSLRTAEWRELRNNLLESIATAIGISISTLASYINDQSNRTAREVSAEETATTLFVEAKRRLFEEPINEMLADVLRFYGYVDDVEIRWTKAGLTNQSLYVQILQTAVDTGLVSLEKAHAQWNDEDDEEQNAEDFAKVKAERAREREFQERSVWGDMGNGTEIRGFGDVEINGEQENGL